MVEYRSQQTIIERPAHEVYTYLADAANYERLMPSSVRSFEANEQGGLLDIQGIGEIQLAFTEQRSPEFLEMKPLGKAPFEFDLQWHIQKLDDQQSEITAVIHAKLNFMMRMMADKILQAFLDTQVDKLKAHLEHD